MRSKSTRRGRGLALGAAGVLAGSLAIAATALATESQTFTAAISPSALSKSKFTPTNVKFDLNNSGNTIGGQLPSPLATADVKIDRGAKIDNKGTPVCQPSRLENTTPTDARKACKTAIIGTGFADAKVLFPGDTTPIDAPSPVTIFNGPPKGGNPVIIIHAYTTIPVPTTFVVPGAFIKSSGPFGRQAHFDVPPIAGGYGSLEHFDVTVNHTAKVKGVKHPYGSAKCKTGTLKYEGDWTYQDGFSSSTSGSAKCTPKK
jgi:hypothetical protein